MASDEAALHKFLKADMEAVLRTLSEKEAGVVRLRFGLVDGAEKTLEDCGKYFGVSVAWFCICVRVDCALLAPA